MALIYQTPFNDMTDWAVESSAASSIVTTGRNGNGMAITNGGAMRYQILPGNQAFEMTLGVAIKIAAVGSATTLLDFRSQSDSLFRAVTVRTNATQGIEARRGTTTILGASANSLVANNVWFYLEVYFYHSNTVGKVTVRMNNNVIIGPLTNQDTNNGTLDTDKYTGIALLGNNTGGVTYDDLYLRNDAVFDGDHVISGPLPGGAKMKSWNGSTFVDGNVKVWNGTAFVDAVAVRSWNGSAWV